MTEMLMIPVFWASLAILTFLEIVQLFIIYVVFSLGSVITAIGMTDLLVIMITAVVLATVVMAPPAEPLSKFMAEHPTTRRLALAFIPLAAAVTAQSARFEKLPT